MAYIGQDPVIGRYIIVDQISGGFNGTASGFTLAAGGQGVIPGLAQNVLLSLGGVIQQPGTDYTVSGSGITFTTPPLSGTTFFATVLGDVQAVGTPSDGTVLPASIATSGTFVFPNITTTGTTLIASGNASTPSLAVIGDTNTGLYSPGADQLSITTGGTERFRIDSAGQLEAVSLGTAAAPTFSFTTDPNTGIYSPGADQLAISTNSSQRLVVDASGKVGVGISPSALMHVSSSYATPSTGGISANTRLIVSNNNAVSSEANISLLYRSNAKGRLNFGNQLVEDVAYIEGGVNYLAFGAGLGSVSADERLRITSAGLVGVGTSAPDGLLHVASASAGTVTANGNANELVVENSSTGGISILTPDANHGYLIFGSPSDNEGAIIRYRHSDGIYTIGTEAAGGSIQLRSGSGTTALTIDSSQRVGIGTTSPSEQLEIYSTSDHRLKVSRATTAIELFQPASASPMLNASGTGVALRFGINGTEGARIDSSGRLGIGTSSPATQLQVIASSSGDICQFGTSAAAGQAVKIGVDTSAGTMYFKSNSSNYRYSFQNTAGTENLVILNSGNVGIGTTSPGFKVDLKMSGGARTDGLVIRRSSNDNHQLGLWTDGGAMYFDAVTDNASAAGVAVFRRSLNSGSTFSESARIDASGRLLVGTSTALGTSTLVVQGIPSVTNPGIYLSRASNASTIVDGNTLGFIEYGSQDNGLGAQIVAVADGTWSSTSDCPTRLVFSTTADGAASPTERMRIDSAGNVMIDSTSVSQTSDTGVKYQARSRMLEHCCRFGHRHHQSPSFVQR
jgi:hypothetical protein